MRIEWSGLSPELQLSLDREGGTPLGSQLADALRTAIRSGRLRSGERLPSSRELARQLGTSRGLVQDCYTQLGAEGYLVARPGASTRVADVTFPPPPATPAPTAAHPRLAIDFASGVPDLASFPRADWSWAQREVVRGIPNAALDYGDPRGDPRFREVIAAYLRRVRGAHVDPAHLVVCAGFAQGLALALRVLADSGVDRVGFESPGFGARTRALAERLGLRPVSIPVDEQGVRVDAVVAGGVRALVLTPAHQWPTGVVLAPSRRQALLAWASAEDATIIEDDYDAEFRYDREPVGALQGLAPEHVLLLGTVSKSLAPALRLGWMICPPRLTEAVVLEKDFSDRGAPALDQLALAALLESGRYDRHLRRMRATYSERRRTLVESLARHAPTVRLTGLAAGFHAVAHLPPGSDETHVIAAARERSVGLHGMSAHRPDGATVPAQLILGFGNLANEQIAEGIAAVGDLLDQTGGGER